MIYLFWASLILNIIAGGIQLSQLFSTGELSALAFVIVHVICIVWLGNQIDKYKATS